MTNLSIEATSRTPAITIDAEAGTFVIEGESYPEDIASFYLPVRMALTDALDSMKTPLKVDIKLVYFNSSSARVLMEILDQMEEKAAAGQAIVIDWHCDPDDDITREFAEDISDDLSAITFQIIDADPA